MAVALAASGALVSVRAAVPPGLTTILYVDASAEAGGDGSSWSGALQRLEDALLTASAGAEIRVAGGTYRPDGGTGLRTRSFVLRSGVTVRGGYAGSNGTDPNVRNPVLYPTVLSGDIGNDGDASDNTYRVVLAQNCGAGTVLDSFTIIGGSADGTFPNDGGAGLWCENSSVAVIGCEFTESFAGSTGGGGVYCRGGGAPTFTDTSFHHCTAEGSGGGVSLLSTNAIFTRCTFRDNYSQISGGGVASRSCSPALTDCSLEGNFAVFYGGGAYTRLGGPVLTGCTFRDNMAFNDFFGSTHGGGALYADGAALNVTASAMLGNLSSDAGGAVFVTGGSLTMARSVVMDNFAFTTGGGLHHAGGAGVTLVSCLVRENASSGSGAGLFSASGSPGIVNCTFHENQTYLPGAAGGSEFASGSPVISNSIYWKNRQPGSSASQSAQMIGPPGGGLYVQRSCVAGWTGSIPGIDNVAVDPLFTDPDGADNVPGTLDDDLTLTAGSPVINWGQEALLPTGEVLDVLGMPRVNGTEVDAGAAEFDFACPADWNHDGRVDSFDYDDFTSDFFAFVNSGTGFPDFNSDSTVDAFDYDDFLSAFFTPCG